MKENVITDTFQKITMLALFVSDCYGGSDKTHNVTNMRQDALVGTAGTPVVCSYSSTLSAESFNGFVDNGMGASLGSALLSVYLLCETGVENLKARRRSNVLPLGSLQFGVCRHQAILVKYLSDTADSVIPCKLV